jgi:hypothetical protein
MSATALQTDLFTPAIVQQFETWKQQPGAGKVISLFYRKAAGFYHRYQARGVGVSQRLIEELTRDEIRRNEQRGVSWDGYTLNSHFTAHIVRHMLNEHPEWKPMFELRELGKQRSQRKVIVITEKSTGNLN